MICFFIAHSAYADVTADFTANQTTIVAGDTIQFTDLSAGNPTTWEWDFQNDGTIDSYVQNPAWIYEEPGLFTVSLTVSDGTTPDTETKTDYIDVRVYIPDENFKSKINEYLGQPPAYNPTIADLNGITAHFFAGNSNISSIEGAQYLTNLTWLSLNNNQIIDISTISGLANLTSLELYNNQIIDISVISGLVNLSLLDLEENQISDISVISDLTNLILLNLIGNQIKDISAISGLTNLINLYLGGNQISDISAVSGLNNLKNLYLVENQIVDISAVSGLTNLHWLWLNDNQIIDISAVSDLTNLTWLWLNENKIIDISAVSGLTNLVQLYLNDNQISDIYPLVENTGLDSGDFLQLNSNPLSREAFNVHIPILESRGFHSLQFPSTPNNYAACYPDPARYETIVYINADLEWQGNFPSRDAVYDVWLGETSDDLVNVGYGTAINDTLYSFTPDLNPDTVYWWKVRAITETDTVWSGLWCFTTYIIADFSADQTSIEEGDTIQFTDLSIGNLTNWEWDFENDGTIDSYEQNSEWIYTEAGIYSVSLTVSEGIYTDTELKENYITVHETQTPYLVSLTPGIEEITLEWETIPEKDNASKETGKSKGHWNVEQGSTANIWTIFVGSITLDGIDLVAGDEIAIFDGDLLVGAFTLTQVCIPNNAFDNALYAYDILSNGPGFTPGNPFIFKAWDQSENLESTSFEYTFSDPYPELYTGDVFPSGEEVYSIAEFSFSYNYVPTFNIYYEDGTLVAGEVEGTTFTDMDLTAGQEYCYYVTQIFESGEESDPSNVLCATPAGNPGIQNYYLEPGFQFVSSHIIPDNSDMLIVMADVLNDNLDFVRNSLGQTLRKIGPNWVNGIGDWIIDEGYLLKMLEDDSFTIEGTLIDPTSPIPVEAGFQFVSYFPKNPMDALIAFETIIGDDLGFIRDSDGTMIRKIGSNWVNGIGDCIPGEGYLVKMFADDFLIYPASFCCGDPFTDPRDQQTYNTVQIGSQCWMAENLNIGEMIIAGPYQTNNGIIEKYCYDNDPANCEAYGGLYQWNEMMEYVTDTVVQGICPEGWFLPTDTEWTQLVEYVVSQGYPNDWNDPNGTGNVLKSCRQVNSPLGGDCNTSEHPRWNENFSHHGFDAFDFSSLPGGTCGGGSFYSLGSFGYWWSSTQRSIASAWKRRIYYGDGAVFRNPSYEANGFSVRCISDYRLFYNMTISGNGYPNELSGQKIRNLTSPDFSFEGGNPADPVFTIYVDGLEIGYEVAAYDGDKMVGATRINSENTFENELPVFSTLTNGRGYEEGNQIRFKVWSENKLIPTDFIMVAIYDSYVSDVYPEGDGKYSVVNISKEAKENVEEIISVYPNPTNGMITIENLSGFQNFTGLEITNITGKTVFQTCPYGSNIFNHESKMEIDLSWFEKGIYFISFIGKDFISVKKIVIK